MILGDEGVRQVQEWLIQHHKTIPTCPICGADPAPWLYSIYTPLIVDTKSKFSLRGRVPVVELACEQCAYLLTFAAESMGLSDPSRERHESPPVVD